MFCNLCCCWQKCLYQSKRGKNRCNLYLKLNPNITNTSVEFLGKYSGINYNSEVIVPCQCRITQAIELLSRYKHFRVTKAVFVIVF